MGEWGVSEGKRRRKALKMNEAQLPEVTNVPHDLCAAQVALFLPSRGTAGGGGRRGCWCEARRLQTLTNVAE